MAVCRDAAAGDEEAIRALVQTLGYGISVEDVVERLKRTDRSSAGLIVAVAGEQIVGMASYDIWSAFVEDIVVCRLSSLCVDGKHRKAGVGTQLIRDVERRARAAGCSLIELSSGRREERSEAHGLYAALGFDDRSLDHAFYSREL